MVGDAAQTSAAVKDPPIPSVWTPPASLFALHPTHTHLSRHPDFSAASGSSLSGVYSLCASDELPWQPSQGKRGRSFLVAASVETVKLTLHADNFSLLLQHSCADLLLSGSSFSLADMDGQSSYTVFRN